MPQTINNILQGVYLRLHKRVGDISMRLEGLTGTEVTSTTAVLTRYADDVVSDFTREVFPVPGQATYNATAGVSRYRLMNFPASMLQSVTADGSVMWRARHIIYNGTALYEAGFSVLERDNYLTVNATGTPVYYSNEGDGFISFYPTPNTTAGVTAIGYCIPPSFSVSATASWLPEDANNVMELGVAVRVAEAMRDDPDAYERLKELLPEYEAQKTSHRNNVAPDVARYLWGVAPSPAKK